MRTTSKKLLTLLAFIMVFSMIVCAMSLTTFADDATGGDTTGDSSTGDTTGGDTTGDSSTGDTTGGDTTGDSSTGDTTGGDTTGDSSTGDTTGGDTTGDSSTGDSNEEEEDDHDHETEDDGKLGWVDIVGYCVAGVLFVAMVAFIIWWIPKESDKKGKKSKK